MGLKLYGFKINVCLLGRVFHALTINVSLLSSINVVSHNPPLGWGPWCTYNKCLSPLGWGRWCTYNKCLSKSFSCTFVPFSNQCVISQSTPWDPFMHFRSPFQSMWYLTIHLLGPCWGPVFSLIGISPSTPGTLLGTCVLTAHHSKPGFHATCSSSTPLLVDIIHEPHNFKTRLLEKGF